MKKIFGLLSILALFASMVLFASQAQAQEKTPFDFELTSTQSLYPFVGKTTDVIGTGGDSIWFYTIKRMVPDKQVPYVYLKLNRVNTTGTVAISLYGKHTYNTPDTLLGPTITWRKTTADTLIMFSPTVYRALDYTKLYIKGSSAAAGGKVIYADFKFLEE